jgi:leucyl-tRNA synthetase
LNLKETNQEEIKKIVFAFPKVANLLTAQQIQKIIFVPNKLINIVI